MIFLLAGHHKNDSGAVSGDLKENELNRELQQLVLKRLEQLSPQTEVYTDPFDLTLSQVIKQVKSKATADDVLLEIHFDSAVNVSATGSTAIVANNARFRSQNIAKDLVEITSSILNISNRGVWNEKKSNRGRLGVLHTAANSVLLEVGFIVNKSDMASYEKHKHWLADDIARILLKYAN